MVVDGRYLTAPADSDTPSIAQVLGLTGPNDQVLIAAVGTQLDLATTFHLALVTASAGRFAIGSRCRSTRSRPAGAAPG
ncbi:hypothetical protein AB0K25_19790 [Micromonospora sp. NPDC049257]|uniref:hypothetical protein n=1 Tax=Micromonospora sp. NPDC049257 TaxID=3155771 RepID=UPI00342A25AB